MHHHPRQHVSRAKLLFWLLLAALFALQVNAPPASAQLNAPPIAARSELSIAVARLVNVAREDRGLDRLDVRGHLNEIALDQARRMANRGVLFHNPNLADALIGNWRWVGENVGYGPSVVSVHTAMMASLHHRANILDQDYTRLGTAAIRRGDRVWVVQVFLAK